MTSLRTFAVDQLSVELFQPLGGQQFRIADLAPAAAEQETSLELVEVLPLTRRRPDGRQCFSAVFRRTGGPARDSGMYCVTHNDFVVPALFLTRISYSLDPTDRSAYYELIFN